jgi:hypothetical protein
MGFVYRVFLFLLDRSAPARRSIRFLLDFLKVIITATVCLSSVLAVKPPRNAAYDATLAERRAERISQAVKTTSYTLRIQKYECETCQPVY